MGEKNIMDHGIILKIGSSGSKTESIEDFKESYYAREYAHAFQVVKSIISQKINMRNQIHGERDESEIFNIIPFIGSRGTGKTTAMCSFARALEQYNLYLKQGKKEFYQEYLSIEEGSYYKCQFTCLEAIDGSLLEQGENIFNIILAQMYNRFLDMDKHGIGENEYYGYEKRELQQSFDEVFRSMYKIENGGKPEEESYITSLTNLSSSLSIKKSFKHLVAQFLKMLRTDKYEERAYNQDYEHFLVITIDDLDLNIDAGFGMLELIHRYMMVPQVIILVAVDYDQLQMLCEKHFYKAIPQVDKILVQSKKNIDRLSQDFINKVLPFDARIYMPSFVKYKDSFGEIAIQRNGIITDIKKAVFQEIYRKIGVRMDIAGKKKHFYEADNIREFVNLYAMIEGMKDLSNESNMEDGKLNLYRNNYSIFVSDVRHRMVKNRLHKQERQVFDRLKDESIDRSCRRLMDEVKIFAEDKSSFKTKAPFVNDIEKYGYSYGELLRSIYCVGRLSNRKKELVRCLLAYYSIEMTHAYFQYKYSEKENEDSKRTVFKEILNGSFGGSWSNMIMPEVEREDDEGFISNVVKTGAVRDVVMKEVFKIDITVPEVKNTENNYRIISQWIKKVFKTVITLAMFFKEPYHNNMERNQWSFKVSTKDPERPGMSHNPLMNPDLKTKHIEIGFDGNIRKTFNVFNFVPNVFEAKETLKAIQEALYIALKNDKSNNWIFKLFKEYNEMDEFINFLEISNEFEIWQEYSLGFVLPIYDLDLVYNLMKRIRLQRIWNETEKPTRNWQELWDYFENILNRIGEKLAENDKYYEIDNGQKLEVLYRACPFVNWIETKEENLVEGFAGMFADMVHNAVLVGEPESGDLETEVSRFED